MGAMPQQAAVAQVGMSLKGLPLPWTVHPPQIQQLQVAGGGLQAKGAWGSTALLAVAEGLSLPRDVRKLSTCWVLVVACRANGTNQGWHASPFVITIIVIPATDQFIMSLPK